MLTVGNAGSNHAHPMRLLIGDMDTASLEIAQSEYIPYNTPLLPIDLTVNDTNVPARPITTPLTQYFSDFWIRKWEVQWDIVEVASVTRIANNSYITLSEIDAKYANLNAYMAQFKSLVVEQRNGNVDGTGAFFIHPHKPSLPFLIGDQVHHSPTVYDSIFWLDINEVNSWRNGAAAASRAIS